MLKSALILITLLTAMACSGSKEKEPTTATNEPTTKTADSEEVPKSAVIPPPAEPKTKTAPTKPSKNGDITCEFMAEVVKRCMRPNADLTKLTAQCEKAMRNPKDEKMNAIGKECMAKNHDNCDLLKKCLVDALKSQKK